MASASGPEPLLSRLSRDERRLVLASARQLRFARREVIFHEGDRGQSLHIIEHGRVAARVTTFGGEIATLTVLGPGEVLGELALVAPDARRTATAVALESTDTIAIERDRFDELRRDHPAVDRFLVEALASVVRRLTVGLVEALYLDAELRVQHRLVDLVGVYGGGDGTIVPLTQEELASMAGTSRATVNRVLQAAAQAGVVALGRGRVEVLDVGALSSADRWT